jgi:hypothetical protein
MITKDDIAPGSLVRSADWVTGPYAGKIGILLGFDQFGIKNAQKGEPLVLWVGRTEPVRCHFGLALWRSNDL